MTLVELRAPRTDVFVSAVVVLEDGTANAADRVRQLAEHLAGRYRNYEVVVVDNRLPSETVAALRDLLPVVPCLRVLRLSRRSPVDTAVFAGLEAAIGDYVVVTAPTYDPPAAVLDVLERLRQGADVVEGVSATPLGGGPLVQWARGLFYWYHRRFVGIDIPARATYLAGLTRAAVNALSATGRTHRYLHHLIRYIGFRIEPYEYALLDVQAERPKPRSRAFDAVEMISSYSTHPLRVVTVIGLGAALLNLVYALYVVGVTIAAPHVAAGWPTTSLQLSAMFFILCIVLAVQAEYVGRILAESRREQAYFITEELESDTLIAETERRNVASA